MELIERGREGEEGLAERVELIEWGWLKERKA